MKTDYSIECEECKCFNISPVKCEGCWRKQIKAEILKEIEITIIKLKKEHRRVFEDNRKCDIPSQCKEECQIMILEELKSKLDEK